MGHTWQAKEEANKMNKEENKCMLESCTDAYNPVIWNMGTEKKII